MLVNGSSWALLRFGLVALALAMVTWSYYSFSHSIHNHHFDKHERNHHNQTGYGNHTDHGHGGGDHRHGRGAFEFDLKNPGYFLCGLALPILLLGLVSLVWNPSTSTNGKSSTTKGDNSAFKSGGDVNVKKWTLIWFLLPLLLVMLDGALASHMTQSQGHQMGWNLYIRICMSLMSPSGYAAAWALALFLIPVTKHSPILDWLGVTPVQALAFHRVAGWTGFWNSVLHGFLHLRHLMDVLNPEHVRPWNEQLKILLIPSSWACIGTQNPFQVFWGHQEPMKGASTEEANQCWLALVNATGMISVLAFVLLAATSLPQVRRYSYALFYRVHIPTAWIMLITAIWHYPTCVLVLVPNIIYYLSFNIPVYMSQTMSYYGDKKNKNSSLMEANLIQGGSLELVFTTSEKDHHRHESRFAKVYIPSVSPLYHPFSVFSCQDLLESAPSATRTVSILLRPRGPFTKGITEQLFPSHASDSEEITRPILEDPASSPALLPSPQICFDSFYAGSFGWVDNALHSHDEILLIAGGVGIVPFLHFLPSLYQQMKCASSTSGNPTFDDINDSLLDSTTPELKHIHVHWYCREVGLASYVWYKHLRNHVQGWENDPVCQGRLKIHLHLTSLSSTSPNPIASEHYTNGEDILSSIENSGLDKKISFEATTKPLQDAGFTQYKWLALLLPGSIMLVGTIFHWWWYKEYILSDEFRDDNLTMRSNSVIFTLIFAMLLSVVVEHAIAAKAKRQDTDATGFTSVAFEFHDEEVTNVPTSVLSVSKGRPQITTVVSSMLKADRPGVYSCGPRSLMESVEGAIRDKRTDCVFYTEDSEM